MPRSTLSIHFSSKYSLLYKEINNKLKAITAWQLACKHFVTPMAHWEAVESCDWVNRMPSQKKKKRQQQSLTIIRCYVDALNFIYKKIFVCIVCYMWCKSKYIGVCVRVFFYAESTSYGVYQRYMLSSMG